MPPRPHVTPLLVWMARDPRLSEARAPIVPFTHLLAGAIASDLDGPPAGGGRVFVVTLEGPLATTQSVERWDGTKFDKVSDFFPVPFSAAMLRDLVLPPPAGQPWHGLVFVVNHHDPIAVPQFLQSRFLPSYGRFDQVVYLTDHVLPRVSNALTLGLEADAAQAFYNGVVSTVLRGPRTDTAGRRLIEGLLGRSDFGTQDAPDPSVLPLRTLQGEAGRLFRDACNLNLGIDGAELRRQWNLHDGLGRPTAFDARLDPADRERVHRWGRAVTNRRAGVAISGGGASAYRAVSLLKEIEAPAPPAAGPIPDPIPIDVVAGLSGGALVAAYFCQGGHAGLDRAVANGLFFQLALPIVFLTSCPLQLVIDLDLGFTRVEETDVRYAALTTLHPRTRPPESGVVSAGTLGEGVRASGTLPPAFAPTKRFGTRYTDGGAAALVPARLARECGADITLAVNVLSGPDRSNLLDFLPSGIGDVLYDWTPLGRVVDFAVWYTFMWRRASRRFGELADEFLEYRPALISMGESVLWIFASDIRRQGEAELQVPEVKDLLRRFRDKYKALQTF